MSLIGNRERSVELLVDNLIWGNVVIDWKKLHLKDDEAKEIISHLVKYTINNEQVRKDKEEYKKIIAELYGFLVGGRITGGIIGELHDRETETRVRELESHNQQLAENLSQAYIPSKDQRVGTT